MDKIQKSMKNQKKLLKIQKNEQNSKMNENSKKLLKIPKNGQKFIISQMEQIPPNWTKIENGHNINNNKQLHKASKEGQCNVVELISKALKTDNETF